MIPEHGEMGFREFVFAGEIQPDLKKFHGIVRILSKKWKHFGMLDPAPAVSHCTSPSPVAGSSRPLNRRDQGGLDAPP